MDRSATFDQRKGSNTSSGFFQRAVTYRSRTGDGSSETGKGGLGLTTLHTPVERKAVADLVFVHGLGGGSRKTWTKDENPSLFWPQEWLPQDEAFQDVRIHTFGYDANYDKESILNIHDFAKDLLGWLKDSPNIPTEEQSPIVLVCHSLGGLVAKRAYTLSKQLKEYQNLSVRIQSIVFLATPHRGSNMAELLSGLFALAGSRPFVADLHPNSVMIEAINDEFPHHCRDLQLHSFYETKPMSFGVKRIVVPKDSAVLGYENERSNFLANANHREVCKFASDQDPNYLTVRNAIATIIRDVRGSSLLERRETDYSQQLQLKECLDIDDTHDDDFQENDSERIPGSCAWITEFDTFQRWRDSSTAHMYWLAAQPGTGKSVLSGFLIRHLRDLKKDCVFYFFTRGDKYKSTLSHFLRSLAWQMASMDPEVSSCLLKQLKRDTHLATADYRTIWRKLFLDGIFKLDLPGKQYVVIDALDECSNGVELVPMLIKAAGMNRMRIFLTSRNKFETYGSPLPTTFPILSETIPQDSSTSDISLYINANLHSLPALGQNSDEGREHLLESIIQKSSGCFLWVHLVLKELRNTHTSEEIKQVLEDVPSDMDKLYSRILDSMSNLKRGKPLTQAILAWTVCAARPLTTSELHEALELDMNDKIDSVERSISSTCGQLVYVDASSRVHMVHQTAREYLLQPTNYSEFAIRRKEGHERLAMVCLNYLCGNEMAGPKNRKLSGVDVRDRSPFAAYASNALADHITFVSSESDELLYGLGRFLRSPNLLSWIEFIARNSDLNRLIQTGRALKNYLQRRSQYLALMGKDVALLDAWSTDLPRLVTKFGGTLSSSPTSIHHLIPPFCPPETAISRQFASSNRSMTIKGLSATTWDDCSCVLTYQNEIPTSVACSSSLFAIGQRSGLIRLHNASSCQELRALSHGKAIKLLRFSEHGDLLVSVSLKSICVWDVRSWELRWRFEIELPCRDVSFIDNDEALLGTLNGDRIVVWDLTTGEDSELPNWADELDPAYMGGSPLAAKIGGHSTMLAVAYRGQDVIVWDLDTECVHGIYGQDVGFLGRKKRKRPGAGEAMSLIFSPHPEQSLLAVGYGTGELVVFDIRNQIVQARASQANAHTMASSPDGMILACANSAGMILIFEFENLRLLYRIVSEEYAVKDLAFTTDSHRLIDIRGPQCRIWDPPVLLRDALADEHKSDTVSVSTMAQEYLLEDADKPARISALVCVEEHDVVICGKIDGSICVYNGKTGEQQETLATSSHDATIICLSYDAQSGILNSADIDNCVVSYQLTKDQNIWHAKMAFEHRADEPVTQLLANTGCTRLLISTTISDILCGLIPDGGRIMAIAPWPDRGPYQWTSHPTASDRLILVVNNAAHIFEWNSLERMTPLFGIQMEGGVIPELSLRALTPCFDGQIIATAFSETLTSRSKTKLFLWHTSDFQPSNDSAASIPHYQPLADEIECIIGTHGNALVFLHQDGWVCSVDQQNFDVDFFDRHFPFPADWLSSAGASGSMLGIFARSGNIVFVQGDEIAIVHHGLEQFESGQSRSSSSKRPSLGSLRPMSSRSKRPISGQRSPLSSYRPSLPRSTRSNPLPD